MRNTISVYVPISMVALLLAVSITLGLKIGHAGYGNAYYTATTANMLQSPYHFIFTTADAGNVMVDKPPVAIWIQTIFASFIGVSGFSVVACSLFATLLSVSLLYRIVREQVNHSTGLLAAVAFAVTPGYLAVARTNMPDSLLILALLITTMLFTRAIQKQSYTLLLSAMLTLGIAFNIKMLQAYLILPAIGATYWFAQVKRNSQFYRQMLIAGSLLLCISLIWVALIDMIPAGQRPYVGSTQHNSAIELTFSYNGLLRLIGFNQGITVPDEIAIVDVLSRPFSKPLNRELSWLLPFAMLGTIYFFLRPAIKQHRIWILYWSCWLCIGLIVICSLEFFHSYYLATLAPALATLVAISFHYLIQQIQGSNNSKWMAIAALTITLLTQYHIATTYDMHSIMLLFTMLTGVTLTSIMIWQYPHRQLTRITYLATLMLIPTLWSIATVIYPVNMLFPSAYQGQQHPPDVTDFRLSLTQGNTNILDIVEQDSTHLYDIAVSNASIGADISIDSDLRVLYLGGFGGIDPIFDLNRFQTLLNADQIGYIVDSGQHVDLMRYTAEACDLIREIFPRIVDSAGQPSGGLLLYEC